MVFLGTVPARQVINADQTAVHLCPVSKKTLAVKGSKSVTALGAEDKRIITAMLACTAGGNMLAPQLVFEGKTTRTLPPEAVRKPGWHYTFSANHWANLSTLKEWLLNVLDPYCQEEMNKSGVRQCILMVDAWRPHLSQEFRDYVAELGYLKLCYVPASCTPVAQPLDIGCNKPFKSGLSAAFATFISNDISAQLAAGAELAQVSIDLRMVNMKPRVSGFIQAGLDVITEEVVKKSWAKAGLDQAWVPSFQAQAIQQQARLFASEDDDDDGEDDNDNDDDVDELDLEGVVRAAAGAKGAKRARTEVDSEPEAGSDTDDEGSEEGGSVHDESGEDGCDGSDDKDDYISLKVGTFVNVPGRVFKSSKKAFKAVVIRVNVDDPVPHNRVHLYFEDKDVWTFDPAVVKTWVNPRAEFEYNLVDALGTKVSMR